MIGLQDDELVQSGGTPEDSVLDMLGRGFKGQEIVTVFGGPQKTQEDLDALAARIGKEFPSLEIETHAGGPGARPWVRVPGTVPVRVTAEASESRPGQTRMAVYLP